VVLLLLGGAFWGGRYSITASQSISSNGDSQQEITVVVEQGAIGRSLNFTGSLSAQTQPGPMVNRAGIVTVVNVKSGDEISGGQALFSVDLQPVIAGAGAIPSFRDLGLEIRGQDVVQLRQFLCQLGFSSSCQSDHFDASLEKSVKAWQKSIGASQTGVVALGDIIWFPNLPVRVNTAAELVVGKRLAADDRPLSTIDALSALTVVMTADQSELVPEGVNASFGDGLTGRLRRQSMAASVDPALASANSDSVIFELVTDDGASSVCQVTPACADLLGDALSVTIPISVEVIPQQEGLVLPVQAIHTSGTGRTYVVLADHTQVDVTVLGSSGGIALVEGLVAGDAVLASGE
jgi:hypothetical protein